jgi:CheY-like chemotaxis protein
VIRLIGGTGERIGRATMSGTDAGVFGRWAKGRIKGALEDANPQGDRDAIIRRLASFSRSVKVGDNPAGAPLPGRENTTGGAPGSGSVPEAVSRMREVSAPDVAGNPPLAPPDPLCGRAVMAAESTVVMPVGADELSRNGMSLRQGDSEPAGSPASEDKEVKPPKPDATVQVREMPLVLIAEDEPVTQQIVRRILESRGYETVVAADGVLALMQLARRRFDLILSDLLMPDLGGFKLLEILNKKEISTPVVFLTASDDVEDEIKGLSLGAKDYIRKPVNRDLLLLRVRKAIGQAVAG